MLIIKECSTVDNRFINSSFVKILTLSACLACLILFLMPDDNHKPKKAYVLTSGGLDSTIAVKMLQDQGIHVTGVYVSTGFCINSHQKKSGRFDESKPDVFKVTEELGIELEVIDISKDYLSIITNPVYGWGKNVNPCIDCRIHMLQKTRELMEKNSIDFVATGEVLGQRPMSQRSDTSKLIEEKSGLKGFLLRPLSGQLHKTTKPEELGWIDRGKLGRIQGRSRKEQYKLARHYNLQNISSPAGGCCLLTDETYAVRFKDYLKDRKSMLQSDKSQPINTNTMLILGTGRQVKIRTGLKLAMGRNEGENKLINHYAPDHVLLEPEIEKPGPTGILEFVLNENEIDTNKDIFEIWKSNLHDMDQKALTILQNYMKNWGSYFTQNITPEDIFFSASILARYADSRAGEKVTILVSLNQGSGHSEKLHLQVLPYDNEAILSKQLVIKPNEKYLNSL